MLALATLLTILCVDQPPAALPKASIALVATGASLMSAAVGTFAGIYVEKAIFDAKGVPQLGWFSVAASIAFLATAALTHAVVPAVLPLSEGGEGHGSTGQARQRGFLASLIPLGIGTLGAASALAGSALENGRYGSGQAFIALGLIAMAFSAIAHQVVEIIGASRGYADSWVATPAPP